MGLGIVVIDNDLEYTKSLLNGKNSIAGTKDQEPRFAVAACLFGCFLFFLSPGVLGMM